MRENCLVIVFNLFTWKEASFSCSTISDKQCPSIILKVHGNFHLGWFSLLKPPVYPIIFFNYKPLSFYNFASLVNSFFKVKVTINSAIKHNPLWVIQIQKICFMFFLRDDCVFKWYKAIFEGLNNLKCPLHFFLLLKSELDVPFKVKAGQIGKYFHSSAELFLVLLVFIFPVSFNLQYLF